MLDNTLMAGQTCIITFMALRFFKMLAYHHVSTRKSLPTSTHCFLVNGLDGRNIQPSRTPYLTTFDLWRVWR